MRIQIPNKLVPVFAPARGDVRFRDLNGGRGSGKSFTAAKMAAVWGANERLRILCTRDIQDSIKESFHAELRAAIASDPWLSSVYDVGVDYLRSPRTGTEFLFKGLRHSIGAIKSTAAIDLCIIEEAEDVSESAWIDLEPTIRAPRSEIWTLWNPRIEDFEAWARPLGILDGALYDPSADAYDSMSQAARVVGLEEVWPGEFQQHQQPAVAPSGHDSLWGWFGLSRASWLTVPRVLMHAMPDRWQGEMARLLNEYDAAWDMDGIDLPTAVQIKKGRRFIAVPDWLLNYRHPDRSVIDSLRAQAADGEGQ